MTNTGVTKGISHNHTCIVLFLKLSHSTLHCHWLYDIERIRPVVIAEYM